MKRPRLAAVPLLGPTDPLPGRPHRVVVNGTSGSGKSTIARTIGARLEIPYVELDSLHHGPNWTPRPVFTEEVARFTSQQRWVTEFQYDAVRPLLLSRADLFVWLDLPRHLVMGRLVRRTLRRRLRSEELWHGNKEPPLRTFFTHREHVVRHGWRTHADTGHRARQAVESRPALPVVRLRSAAETESWLNLTLAAV